MSGVEEVSGPRAWPTPSPDLTRRGEPMLAWLLGALIAILTGLVFLIRGLFAVKDLWRVVRMKMM